MLYGISWGTFLLTLAIVLFIYYLIITITYYRKELSNLLKGKIKPNGKQVQTEQDKAKAGLEELEVTVNKIKGILETAGDKAGKEGLLYQLNQALASYDGLHHPAYRNAIKNYIIKNAQEICGVGFSEEELEAEWEAFPAD